MIDGEAEGTHRGDGLRVFLEVTKPKADTSKIVKLNMRNLRLSGNQAAFQVVIALIMAHLVVRRSLFI